MNIPIEKLRKSEQKILHKAFPKGMRATRSNLLYAKKNKINIIDLARTCLPDYESWRVYADELLPIVGEFEFEDAEIDLLVKAFNSNE